MGSMRGMRRAGALLAAVAVVGLAASVAVAGVTVYSNKFARKADAKEMRHGEGKRCRKGLRKKARTLRIKVKRGPDTCGYRPPVQGITDGPNHDFRAKAKLNRDTPKRIRDSAFLAITVRSGRSSGYQLRVFPTKRKFELTRAPSGGGSGFPARGKSSAVKGFRQPNVLRLKVVDDRVTARVNGTRVARATDPNPAQVGGRRLQIAVGNRRHSRKPVYGTVDNLRLQVPSP